MGAAHIVHTSSVHSSSLERQPEIDIRISGIWLVIRLILMPGRRGPMSGRFEDHVVILKLGFWSQDKFRNPLESFQVRKLE